MPYYSAPNTDIARLTFLRKAVESGQADVAAMTPRLMGTVLTDAESLYNSMNEAMREVKYTLSERGREVLEADKAIERMQMFMGHMWEMIRMRAKRNNEPVTVFQYYRMDQNGLNPELNGREELIDAAQDMVAGDARAVAAGYPAAVCPSAAELDAIAQMVIKESAEVTAAKKVVATAEQKVQSFRPNIDAAIKEIVDQLRFNLRKEAAPFQRRIMRLYGATFRYYEGETRDSDDPVAPVADPEPPA